MKREHLSQFYVAGFSYYEGTLAFNKLKIGRKLTLLAEPDNKYDPEAIAIYYKEYKIGYIPRAENTIISKLIKVGFNQFDVRVQILNKEEHPARQVGVVLFLTDMRTK